MLDSYLVLLLTSIACSTLGVFLVLRNMSMLADAISHSVLLGIVIAFFITRDLRSVYLIIGAGIFGLISVFCIESLAKSQRIVKSDAVGVVFPLFFAIAVILISRYARNVQLNTETILVGEVTFASLDKVNIFGLVVARNVVKAVIMGLLNIIFVYVYYKGLKIASFDESYAILLGYNTTALFYIFMSLTSFTAVVSFEAIGSVLALSFFITAPASAYLIAKSLWKMIAYSILFSFINCTLGFLIAIYFDVSMSGTCAFIGMLIFVIMLIVTAVKKILHRKDLIINIKENMFIMHIGNHLREGNNFIENNISNISKHLNWNNKEVQKISKGLMLRGLVKVGNNEYTLSEKGVEEYNILFSKLKG